jgi:RNA polymerase sigma-70 factor (ECF subfamily)
MTPAGASRDELRELYERYAAIVHRRCRAILGSEDEAWDATQEVFVKLHHELPRLKKKGSIYSWLLTVGTNYCISQLRKSRTIGFVDEAYVPDAHSQEQRFVLKEILNHLMKPWDRKVREMLIFAYLYGYTQPEIARLTGMGESTIRKYLTLFKRKSVEIRAALEGVNNV